MKRILSALLLVVYFTVSSGFVVSLHYCMNRLDSVGIGAAQSDKCGKCGMHKDGGCCHDVVKVVKLNEQHLSAQTPNPDFGWHLAAPLPVAAFQSPAPQMDPASLETAHGPPLPAHPLYLLHRVFRI